MSGQTAGAAILDEVTAATNQITASAKTELDRAVSAVLCDFLFRYEVFTDTPECPSCADGYCGGHAEETYHEGCVEAVEGCACIAPYRALALLWARAVRRGE